MASASKEVSADDTSASWRCVIRRKQARQNVRGRTIQRKGSNLPLRRLQRRGGVGPAHGSKSSFCPLRDSILGTDDDERCYILGRTCDMRAPVNR